MRVYKIAYIVNHFPQLSEAFLINQIIDLIDQGHDVRIYASSKSKPPYHQKVLDYHLIEKMEFLPLLPQSKFAAFLIFILFLSSHLKSIKKIFFFIKKKSASTPWQSVFWLDSLLFFNPDVIHAHFGSNGVVIADFIFAKLLKKMPFITTFHGYDLHRSSGYLNGYKRLLEYGDVYTVNSGYTKKILLQLNFPKEKIEILPVGLDTKYFKPERKVNVIHELITILFVGRLIALKAPDIFILICKELINRGFKVRAIIIGTGELQEKINSMIFKNCLSDSIELKGALTQSEIIRMMDLSNLFLFPGIYDCDGRAEAQGLVIQEAQSMKLPVIVSDVGGMKDGLIDGVTGFIVHENDIIGFADKIEFFIKNPSFCDTMGVAGREYVISNFDNRILGKRLINLYKHIIKQELK